MIEIIKIKFFLFKFLINIIIIKPVRRKINNALVDLASLDKKGVGKIKPCIYSSVEIIRKLFFQNSPISSFGNIK
jgi:hypothetical protein